MLATPPRSAAREVAFRSPLLSPDGQEPAGGEPRDAAGAEDCDAPMQDVGEAEVVHGDDGATQPAQIVEVISDDDGTADGSGQDASSGRVFHFAAPTPTHGTRGEVPKVSPSAPKQARSRVAGKLADLHPEEIISTVDRSKAGSKATALRRQENLAAFRTSHRGTGTVLVPEESSRPGAEDSEVDLTEAAFESASEHGQGTGEEKERAELRTPDAWSQITHAAQTPGSASTDATLAISTTDARTLWEIAGQNGEASAVSNEKFLVMCQNTKLVPGEAAENAAKVRADMAPELYFEDGALVPAETVVDIFERLRGLRASEK